MPELGKPVPEFMQRVILSRLGARRPELLQGSEFGVDNAVIRVGDGTVAVCTTDPISLIPSLGAERSGWLSVHLLASDIATSGFPPTFAIFDLNLPPKMEDAELERYWNGVHVACRELNVSIAGGHTGRFVGCDYTIMGAGFMMAIGPEDRYLTSSMAREHDRLIITKGAAIATTGILAHAFPRMIEKDSGKEFAQQAQRYLDEFSTSKDAITAASIGVRESGVTAMHDVTEGGILRGIFELLHASGKGARIDKKAIHVSEVTRRICSLFGIDPFNALGEGALVICVRPEKTTALQKELEKHNITSYLVGEVLPSKEKILVTDESGERVLQYPEKDSYWEAYWRAINKGWN
jgi:hydrogenase maturation factor